MIVYVENPRKPTKKFLEDIISELGKASALPCTINKPLENDRSHGLCICQNPWNTYVN